MNSERRGTEQPQSLQDGLPWIDGGQAALMDPWGKPYQFQWVEVAGKQQPVVSTTDPDGNTISSMKN
jgi:hypothetical protein